MKNTSKCFGVSCIFTIFVLGIVGFGHPMTRAKLVQPFPINKGQVTIIRTSKMPKKKSLDDVKADFRNVWGNTYNYDLITENNYKNLHSSVPIICPTHGIFKQLAYHHKNGKGCPLCSKEKQKQKIRLSTKEVIDRIKKVHGDKYDYSLFVYVDMHTKSKIICKEHGMFMQAPHEHIKGSGCPYCSNRVKITKDMFLENAHKKFGNKFTYKIDDFIDVNTQIEIICPKHGSTITTPDKHLSSRFGCTKCAREHFSKLTTYSRETFIEKAKGIWGDTYDYSLITDENYINTNHKVSIICKKHGVWVQKAKNHLSGQGCPKCSFSRGEKRVEEFLLKFGVEYIHQYKICCNFIFFENSSFRVDFYLPKCNAIIEYNGQQHYKEIPVFNTRNLEQQQERDAYLRKYCKESKIKLIEIPYWDFDNIEKILKKSLGL